MQSDKCLINMYISMWKLWIKNIYICLRKNKLLKKKVHWNIGLGYECVYLFISCLCNFMIVCSWFDKCTDRTDRLICIKFHGNICMIVRSPNPEDFISVQSLRTELVKFAKYTRGRHKPVQYTKKDICWAFASWLYVIKSIITLVL